MGKKYVPSGYQIINIVLSYDEDANKYVIEESEDKNILANILLKLSGGVRPTKPILLTVDNQNDSYFDCSFANVGNNNIFLIRKGGSYYDFYFDGTWTISLVE